MRKENLVITTRGVKGGKTHTNVTGSVICRMSEPNGYGTKKEIFIDAFKGMGATYEQRETPLIDIEGNNFRWSGSFDDLTNIISFARQMQWLCQADKPADYKAEIENIMQQAKALFTNNK